MSSEEEEEEQNIEELQKKSGKKLQNMTPKNINEFIYLF